MKASLLRRIEKLEQNPRWQPPPPPTAQDRLYWKKLEQLLSEIDDKYACLIRADLKRAPRDMQQWSGLAQEFDCRVLDHVSYGTPLAFPPAVAEAYWENPSAGSSASCQRCHYRLPRGYFKLCPLCNGVVY